ncbi:MAG: hypothetical protein JO133_10575 [Burkholderiaceae bacterium]|nr:hypothetical protein [Burkholderiaceae bacterium]
MDLEVVDALRAAGVPDDKARAVVASLHREIDQRYVLHAAQLATRSDLMETAARLERRLGEMATRADLAETAARLEGRLGEMATRADLAELRTATRADLAELRTATRADLNEAFARLEAKIAETRVDLMRWFFGSFLAMGGVLIAVLRLTAH